MMSGIAHATSIRPYRKRRNSDSTPPITKYFATVRRERSNSETKNISSQSDDSQCSSFSQCDNLPQCSLEHLRDLLAIPNEMSLLSNAGNSAVNLENLPMSAYAHIFTILDLRSVSTLALVSTKLSSRVKSYVSTHDFYNRFHLDNIDFLNSSFRPEDEDFVENDPFIACGALIKSITITQDTSIRAEVFLNICRNLCQELNGSLDGFARLLEAVTENWKLSEKRVMAKAAILINPTLRQNLIQVLKAKPGELPLKEMSVRSGLTQLFLNRNQDVYESTPQEIIEFGSWLSVVLRHVTEKFQGRLYYILFGPTKSSKVGERIQWNYFCEDANLQNTVYKKVLTCLLNGICALRIMNNSNSTDMAWDGKGIYTLFLRILEACSFKGNWTRTALTMSFAIDSSGLFNDYLISGFVPGPDFHEKISVLGDMVCHVRTHLYRWTSNPATFLSEPLHHAFNHLAQLDRHYEGCYKAFLVAIWSAERNRVKLMVQCAKNDIESERRIREELDGQLSMVRLLGEFANNIANNRQALPHQNENEIEEEREENREDDGEGEDQEDEGGRYIQQDGEFHYQ
uniref:F-box domain-containing protein n=1 Tax=Caenorhabditis tropicalis TaxID=1561998 RepID=A0A1I7T237_9PELO